MVGVSLYMNQGIYFLFYHKNRCWIKRYRRRIQLHFTSWLNFILRKWKKNLSKKSPSTFFSCRFVFTFLLQVTFMMLSKYIVYLFGNPSEAVRKWCLSVNSNINSGMLQKSLVCGQQNLFSDHNGPSRVYDASSWGSQW